MLNKNQLVVLPILKAYTEEGYSLDSILKGTLEALKSCKGILFDNAVAAIFNDKIVDNKSLDYFIDKSKSCESELSSEKSIPMIKTWIDILDFYEGV